MAQASQHRKCSILYRCGIVTTALLIGLTSCKARRSSRAGIAGAGMTIQEDSLQPVNGEGFCTPGPNCEIEKSLSQIFAGLKTPDSLSRSIIEHRMPEYIAAIGEQKRVQQGANLTESEIDIYNVPNDRAAEMLEAQLKKIDEEMNALEAFNPNLQIKTLRCWRRYRIMGKESDDPKPEYGKYQVVVLFRSLPEESALEVCRSAVEDNDENLHKGNPEEGTVFAWDLSARPEYVKAVTLPLAKTEAELALALHEEGSINRVIPFFVLDWFYLEAANAIIPFSEAQDYCVKNGGRLPLQSEVQFLFSSGNFDATRNKHPSSFNDKVPYIWTNIAPYNPARRLKVAYPHRNPLLFGDNNEYVENLTLNWAAGPGRNKYEARREKAHYWVYRDNSTNYRSKTDDSRAHAICMRNAKPENDIVDPRLPTKPTK